MTVSISIASVPNSIAALSVSGVNIKDVDEIPTEATALCPVLFPEPVDFVTNFTSERNTFGTAPFKTVGYDLTYTYCHVPVGAGRSELDYYGDMLTKVGLIINAIMNNDAITGVTDISPQGTIAFGPVPDPAGNMFIGCKLVFHVTEELG